MSRRGDETVEVVAGPPRWRPLGALGLAIVSWLPSARALLHGDVDLTVACVRFLVAVAVAWVGLGLVAAVVRGYVAAPPAEQPVRPQRRRSDREPDLTVDDDVGAIDVNATETSSRSA